MITLIAAVSLNNVIGKGGKIPWRLRDDFKRFKSLTMGHPIVMGRKTYESLGSPLPGRYHLVVSRQPLYGVEQGEVLPSLTKAIDRALEIDDNVFVIGGGQIYCEAIDFADAIELTRVEVTLCGDAFFPEIDHSWEICKEEFHKSDSWNQYDYCFVSYRRKYNLETPKNLCI